MESFETIWNKSDLEEFKSNKRLKIICEKFIKIHLSRPEVQLISISKKGYVQTEPGLTFDINYFFLDKEKWMQVNFYNEDNHTEDIPEDIYIPDSIAFN